MYIPDQLQAKRLFMLIFRTRPEMPCRNPDALGLFVKLNTTHEEFEALQRFLGQKLSDFEFLKATTSLKRDNTEDTKILRVAEKLSSNYGLVISYMFTLTEQEAKRAANKIYMTLIPYPKKVETH